MKRRGTIWLCLIALTLAGCATSREFGGDAPRMSAEELKARLGEADLVVIDVRQGPDWMQSAFKIKGAVREDPRTVAWASRYPREKTILLYCA